MKVVVATHGHCFDGLASAVMFTRLRQAIDGDPPTRPTFEYRGCGYGFGQQRPDEQLLSGDENAILDYRFSTSPKLTWFFDHHRTAFSTSEERGLFDERAGSGRFFFDAECSSCTRLLERVGRENFDFRDPGLDELVRWADIIDTASFESPDQAVGRTDAVLRLAAVIEHYGDDRFLARMVPRLLETPLAEVAGSKDIEDRYRPLGKKHKRFIERVRTHAQKMGRVVFVDLTDAVQDSVGKFVTYALYPECMYSVVVGLMKNGVKISVGYNPWSGEELDADISAICARHGGGGHPVVGGISFRLDEIERARSVAREIVHELSG